MRIYYDTEFHDTGEKIDLISMGLVTPDGREYYAVNSDADWHLIADHKWLCENVVPQLPLEEGYDAKPYNGRWWFQLDRTTTCVKPKWVIANEVRDFILSVEDPELWAYYSAHDHVALTQLWGPLTKAPEGIPWRTNDLMQEIERLAAHDHLPVQESGEHNALEDARWNMRVGQFLKGYETGKSLGY